MARQVALCKQPLTVREVFFMAKITVVMLDKDGKPITPTKSPKKTDKEE